MSHIIRTTARNIITKIQQARLGLVMEYIRYIFFYTDILEENFIGIKCILETGNLTNRKGESSTTTYRMKVTMLKQQQIL